MENQIELARRTTDIYRMSFDFMYPVWKCPDCDWLNRSLYTFGEVCTKCKMDHTLDWEEYIVDPVVKQRMEEDMQVVQWEVEEEADRNS